MSQNAVTYIMNKMIYNIYSKVDFAEYIQTAAANIEHVQ